MIKSIVLYRIHVCYRLDVIKCTLHNAQGTNAQFGMGVIKVGVIKCNWHLSPTSAAALNAEFVDKAIVLFFETFALLLVALSFLPCRIMTNQKRY